MGIYGCFLGRLSVAFAQPYHASHPPPMINYNNKNYYRIAALIEKQETEEIAKLFTKEIAGNDPSIIDRTKGIWLTQFYTYILLNDCNFIVFDNYKKRIVSQCKLNKYLIIINKINQRMNGFQYDIEYWTDRGKFKLRTFFKRLFSKKSS